MPKIDLKKFDYLQVAKLDADMWRAYYNHHFIKLFILPVTLLKIRTGLSIFLSTRVAYYSVWAAAYYRLYKHKGVNNARVLKNLTKFYKIVSDHSVQPFNYAKAAELELAWWDVHRTLYKNSKKLEQSLADAAAVVYNLPASRLQKYAHFRAQAMILPRHEGDKQLIPTDWDKVVHLLNKSWQALHSAVQE